MDLNPNLSIIILNVNESKTPIKRQQLMILSCGYNVNEIQYWVKIYEGVEILSENTKGNGLLILCMFSIQ